MQSERRVCCFFAEIYREKKKRWSYRGTPAVAISNFLLYSSTQYTEQSNTSTIEAIQGISLSLSGNRALRLAGKACGRTLTHRAALFVSSPSFAHRAGKFSLVVGGNGFRRRCARALSESIHQQGPFGRRICTASTRFSEEVLHPRGVSFFAFEISCPPLLTRQSTTVVNRKSHTGIRCPEQFRFNFC